MLYRVDWQLNCAVQDDDQLSKYKIRNADTIHMVKGAAKPSGASPSTPSSTSSSGAPRLPTMQTGQNPHDPLTLLNGPMGHGLSLGQGGLNPFAGLDVNPNDPNMVHFTSTRIVPSIYTDYPR